MKVKSGFKIRILPFFLAPRNQLIKGLICKQNQLTNEYLWEFNLESIKIHDKHPIPPKNYPIKHLKTIKWQFLDLTITVFPPFEEK